MENYAKPKLLIASFRFSWCILFLDLRFEIKINSSTASRIFFDALLLVLHTTHKRKFTTLSLTVTDNNTPITNLSTLTLPQTNNCSKGQENNTNVRFNPRSNHNRNHHFSAKFSLHWRQ